MLNECGGVIDDLIVYYLTEDFFRVVVNAATRDKDLAWITAPGGAVRHRRSASDATWPWSRCRARMRARRC